MLDVLDSDYMRLARAKGLQPRTVLVRHGLRNALIPLTTVTALDIGALFGGAIITETVFQWHGMGVPVHRLRSSNIDVNVDARLAAGRGDHRHRCSTFADLLVRRARPEDPPCLTRCHDHRPADEHRPSLQPIVTPAARAGEREFTVVERSQWQQAFRRFLQHRMAMVSLVVFVLLVLFAFVGPHFWQYKLQRALHQRPEQRRPEPASTRSAPTRRASTCSR